ncbi:hypothetical protein APHAL10511_001821 [Amanita phalloides]|nr:hypothetical protein APHAL10511_001821 [Amanita phalloides]
MSTTQTPNESPLTTPIQPLHNPSQAAHVVVPHSRIGNATNAVPSTGAKALLAKKLAKSHNPNFISPTDNMMTPCTLKLNAARKKQFANGPKPVQLFAQKDQTNSNNGEASPTTTGEEVEKDLDDDNPF